LKESATGFRKEKRREGIWTAEDNIDKRGSIKVLLMGEGQGEKQRKHT